MKQNLVIFLLISILVFKFFVKATYVPPPPVMTCGTQIRHEFYLNKKLVHVDVLTGYYETHIAQTSTCNIHKKPVEFLSDSNVTKVDLIKPSDRLKFTK